MREAPSFSDIFIRKDIRLDYWYSSSNIRSSKEQKAIVNLLSCKNFKQPLITSCFFLGLMLFVCVPYRIMAHCSLLISKEPYWTPKIYSFQGTRDNLGLFISSLSCFYMFLFLMPSPKFF